MPALLTHAAGKFIFRCAFGEQAPAKAAGFRWDPNAKQWWTDDKAKAAAIAQYADDGAKLELAGVDAAPVQREPQGPTLSWDGERFVYRCQREQNQPAKSAGLRWDAKAFVWWTADPLAAGVLRAAADPATMARIEAALEEANEAIHASRATDAGGELPVPAGLAYLPYQRGGIAYAMARSGTLIGDEMGLGKTIQAIGVYNVILAGAPEGAQPRCLVVCPASLRLNWQREVRKWAVRKVSVGFVDGDYWPATADVVIINYDVLERHRKAIDQIPWALLVVDECHYVKSPKAIRTLALLGGKEKLSKAQKKADPQRVAREFKAVSAARKVFLTGTPIGNRPIELWPIVHSLAPGVFSNWKNFAVRYCDAHWNGYAMDVRGASNLDELQHKLRATCMVRRLKSEVLKELPPKRRQVIELPAGAASGAVARESELWAQHQARIEAARIRVELAKASDSDAEYEAAIQAMRQTQQLAFTDISNARHEVALAKLPLVIEHLLNTEGKVIVFCHHKDVAAGLRKGLEADGRRAVLVTGDMNIQDRQASVDAFQQDAGVDYIIGTFGAMGVGHTLTASSHVVAAELDWVPGNMSQAEDRAHRIGQVNSVLVQHVVLEGSLDARMAKVLIEKQEVIREALDAHHGAVQMPEAAAIPAAPEPAAWPEKDGELATQELTRAAVVKEAAAITPAQVEAIHQGLRMLRGVCDGAAALDQMGFSAMDVRIGHSMAGQGHLSQKQAVLGLKLVNKYRRQLPETLLAAAKGEA